MTASKILDLLREGESLNEKQMAHILGISQDELEAGLDSLREEGTLLGWRPILHPEAAAGASEVRAMIEVKITPEREGGFDRIAQRIAKFDAVESCYLMSGAYDLLVVVRGDNLHAVASFVSERLSTIDGVTATATHFHLRSYKEQGYLLGTGELNPDKPAVSA